MANQDTFDSGFSMGFGKSKGKKSDSGKKDDGGKEPPKLGKDIKSFKKGGRVRKTGVYRLHKGEVVVPANKVRGRKKGRKKISAKR